MRIHPEIDFQLFMRELLRLFEAEDRLMFAIHVLKFFDQVFKEKEEYPYLKFGSTVEVNCLRQLGPLNNEQAEYEILDVKHLGRILYIVCKDGLDDIGQLSFRNEYGVNFEVISSFSPSIAFFEQQMSDMISKYKGMAVVANSCSPRKAEAEGETAVGFVKLPYMRKKKPFLIHGLGKEYDMEEQCMKSCTFCSCMHIFDIRPDILQENEILSGMEIDYTKICR